MTWLSIHKRWLWLIVALLVVLVVLPAVFTSMRSFH